MANFRNQDLRRIIHDRGKGKLKKSVQNIFSDKEVEVALSNRPLPDDLKLGSSVCVDARRHFDVHAQRFYLVCGLIKNEGRLEAIEAFYMTTQTNRLYPSDYLVCDPQELQSIDADRPVVIKTAQVVTIPNLPEYFPAGSQLASYNRNPSVILEDVWPDLLVRHAEALLSAPQVFFVRNDFDYDQAELVREGFTFGIPEYAVRSGQWTPFLDRGNFERVQSEILDERTVEQIVAYANRYVSRLLPGPHLRPVIRAYKDWPADQLTPISFRNWEHSRVHDAPSAQQNGSFGTKLNLELPKCLP